jgi:hypothetical protein
MSDTTTSITFLFLLVVSSLEQSSAPLSRVEVMDREEIHVSTVALRDLITKRNPDRIFLRDTTQTRSSVADPINANGANAN